MARNACVVLGMSKHSPIDMWAVNVQRAAKLKTISLMGIARL